MIRLFGSVVCILLFTVSSFARETKLERKANALAIRRILTTLPKISDAYQAPQTNGNAPKLYTYTFEQYQKIQQKFMGLKKREIEGEFAELGKIVKLSGKKAEVNALTEKLTSDLISLFEIPDTPAQKPDSILGADVYKARCSVCHGAEGRVATALAKKLKPAPKDLVTPPLSDSLSPFRVYNVLITGIEGTSKKPMDDQLSDHELWSVAFYVLEMQCKNEGSNLPDKPLTLQTLSRSSDQDFAVQYPQSNSHAALCALRKSYLQNNNVQRK